MSDVCKRIRYIFPKNINLREILMNTTLLILTSETNLVAALHQLLAYPVFITANSRTVSHGIV